MKFCSKLFVAVILLFSAPCLVAEALFLAHQVTASDYCDFLNHIAISDPHFLYDDKMSFDERAASIIRSGGPGNYEYCLIAGREKFSAVYVNEFSNFFYHDWLEHEENFSFLLDKAPDVTHSDLSATISSETSECFLKSNKRLLQILLPVAGMLSIASVSNPSSSPINFSTAEWVVLGVASILLCHELMLQQAHIQCTYPSAGEERHFLLQTRMITERRETKAMSDQEKITSSDSLNLLTSWMSSISTIVAKDPLTAAEEGQYEEISSGITRKTESAVAREPLHVVSGVREPVCYNEKTRGMNYGTFTGVKSDQKESEKIPNILKMATEKTPLLKNK